MGGAPPALALSASSLPLRLPRAPCLYTDAHTAAAPPLPPAPLWQDFLNGYWSGRWQALPYIYNCQKRIKWVGWGWGGGTVQHARSNR